MFASFDWPYFASRVSDSCAEWRVENFMPPVGVLKVWASEVRVTMRTSVFGSAAVAMRVGRRSFVRRA